jgi:hypothetical protein
MKTENKKSALMQAAPYFVAASLAVAAYTWYLSSKGEEEREPIEDPPLDFDQDPAIQSLLREMREYL